MLSLSHSGFVSDASLVTGFSILALLAVGTLLRLFFSTHGLDPHEPPLVRPTVPYVGHLWGLMKYSHEYLANLCSQNPHGIFTIPLLQGKAYVVSSPNYAQAIFKNKNLSFSPFVVEFVGRIDELSPSAKQAYAEGLHTRVMQVFTSTMSGRPLKVMSANALNEVARLLAVSTPVGENQTPSSADHDLWLLLRDVITIAATSSLLGKNNNPWNKDRSLIEAYWTFEAGDITGRASIIDLTDRKGKRSYNSMVAALEAYFVARHDLSVSDDMDEVEEAARMTLDTVELERQHGFTATEIAATYVTIIHGALVNVVPTIFWTVAWVFSRPSLVARLREELLASISIADTAGMQSASEISLDLAILESACPLLLSVFRETQRLAAVGTLHRRVLEDTIVFDDQSDQDDTGSSFFLKKGTSILIPVTNNQRDARVWGSTANDYDPDRFMRHRPHGFAQHTQSEEKKTAKGERLRKQAYYPFGGGKELCPGRSFATLEALGTTAMIVLGFDIRAKDGGIFKAPHFGPSKMTAATARPHADCDLGISLSRREGWENVVWTVKST